MKKATMLFAVGLMVLVSERVSIAQTNTFPPTGNVGIGFFGTEKPSQKLTLGVGNILLPNADAGFNGNLYFGGITDAGQFGMRLFGGDLDVTTGGFIDVRAFDPSQGLLIRVDTRDGGTERMRVTAQGNVGIGTSAPQARLDIVGTTRTGVLEITGGSDIAEPFEISEGEGVKPGMIVAIDPEQPGRLRVTDKAYDRTVAGIVSGANNLNPGLTLTQQGTVADSSPLVSLTGRVYCWVDAFHGPIAPGDLLTTSDIRGHAMKVTDHERAQGAIIGKAMSSLKTGRGLVLTLVTLQ